MERRFLWIRHLAIAAEIKKGKGYQRENNKDRNGTYGIHVISLEFYEAIKYFFKNFAHKACPLAFGKPLFSSI